MDAASSAAADKATSTYLSASSTPTSDASIMASSFSWLSIKDVFLVVLLYMWYMFLFLACGAVIIGTIYLLFIGVAFLFGAIFEHGPKMYESSKKWIGKRGKSSRETDVEAQQESGEAAKSQTDEPKKGGDEDEEEDEPQPKYGTETV
jgi:hypothetical protein